MAIEYGIAPLPGRAAWTSTLTPDWNYGGRGGGATAAAGAGGGTSGGAAGGFAPVNTASVGGDIAKYNLSAIAGDPRLNPIMRNIEGIVPGDLRRNLEQAAAERGIGIGAPNSANANTQLLQALGLTSYDLMTKGVDQYRDLLAGVPKLNPESLFVSPSEQVANNLKMQMQRAALEAEAQRQAEREAAATSRASMGIGASAAAQANELAFKQSAMNAEASRAAATKAATARMIDSILNRNAVGWGGNEFTPGYAPQNDAWTGGDTGTDFFGYLDNLDPNLLGSNPTAPAGSDTYYGGFARDFGLDTGLNYSSTYGAPEGYTFENYGPPSNDYGASDAADFEYAWDTLTGNF